VLRRPKHSTLEVVAPKEEEEDEEEEEEDSTVMPSIEVKRIFRDSPMENWKGSSKERRVMTHHQ
jgi:hypothetical protein